jgi:hypothetical protein
VQQLALAAGAQVFSGSINAHEGAAVRNEPPMQYIPHIDLLLQALRINRERLDSKAKIAIDAKLLKHLLQALIASLPFSEEFYLETYPDIAEAYAAGKIPDLRRHYIELGFFEGRMGMRPQVDEAFYNGIYSDVAAAVQRGDVKSAVDHYMRSGAAEGRIPNAAMKMAVEGWVDVLRNDARM